MIWSVAQQANQNQENIYSVIIAVACLIFTYFMWKGRS